MGCKLGARDEALEGTADSPPPPQWAKVKR